MEFGIDSNGNRVAPFKKGRSFCPVCGGTLIAKCGYIYRYHWQHAADRNCDPWKEHETDWHRNWKSQFPENWREHVIERDGEKHIADVMTAEDMVIEFQNSSISVDTISDRENFYDDMVWVINATKFEQNLSISSIATTKLRNLENEFSAKKSSHEPSTSQEELALRRSLSDVRAELTTVSWKIDRYVNEIYEIEAALQDLGKSVAETVSHWRNESCMPYLPFLEMESCINYLYQAYQHNKTKLELSRQKIHKANQFLMQIARLRKFDYQNIQYLLIDYASLSEKNYHQAIAVKKATFETMFPEVRVLDSKTTFLSFKYKTNEFLFGINPASFIAQSQKDILNNGHEAESIAQEQSKLESHIEGHFRDCLGNIREKTNHGLTVALDEHSELNSKEIALQEELDELVIHELLKNEAALTEIELEYQTQKSNIKTTFKGLYRFQWKHERKSWSEAYFPIYFDVGEHYLFKLIDYNLVKKISVEEFLGKHLSSGLKSIAPL